MDTVYVSIHNIQRNTNGVWDLSLNVYSHSKFINQIKEQYETKHFCMQLLWYSGLQLLIEIIVMLLKKTTLAYRRFVFHF